MLPPADDIQDRKPIWDAMQMLFMDVDDRDEISHIASVCAGSKYSLEELKVILFKEVFPACRFNLFSTPAPEWRGFELDWLVDRILQKQRHGKRNLWFFRRYTKSHWHQLEAALRKADKA